MTGVNVVYSRSGLCALALLVPPNRPLLVPTIRFQVLYVFLVLAHDRRRIVHFNVTTGGTSMFLGVRGQAGQGGNTVSPRTASMSEDPAAVPARNADGRRPRRQLGGKVDRRTLARL